jgi:hypothetical protein
MYYCHPRRHLYYGGQIYKYYIFPPPPQLSLHIGGLCCQAIQMEHGLYIAKRTQKAVYIVRFYGYAILAMQWV